MRLPYEGLVWGPAIAILSLVFGDSWAKRGIGAAFGIGCAVYTLVTAPKEIEARRLRQAREIRRRRADADDE